MNTNHCIYCNSIDHKEWIRFQDIYKDVHSLAKCGNCGIYFLAPQPSRQQLIRAYDESYYGEGDKKFNPLVERVVDWFRSRNAKRFASKLAENARVLDIGCGNGNFLKYLGRHRNVELYGLELPGKSAERASRINSIQLHIGELKQETFPPNYFDAVLLTHVFEHLPNPREILEIIQTISKVDATVQIELPNIDSWQARLFKGNWLHLDPPRHLHFFTPNQLKMELKKYGFSCIQEHYFSPQFSPFGAQQSILNFFLKKREVLYEHIKGNKTYTAEYPSIHLFFQKLFHWVSFPFFIITDVVASIFSKGATVKMVFKKNLSPSITKNS